MPINLFSLCSVLFCWFFLFQANAQTPAEQPIDSTKDVRLLLKELEYNYQMTETDDYKLIFNIDKERSQVITVNANTVTYADREVRELWSLVYVGKERPSYELSMNLLQDNSRKKFGAWEVGFDEEDATYYVAFSVKISGTADISVLNAAIQMVIEAADEMEAKISDTDDF
ncbi:MAG: hypothetical protein AAGI38_07090 [Bacteroidota bacterium]